MHIILIKDEWMLEKDTHQWILKNFRKSDKSKTGYTSTQTYYPNLEQAARRIAEVVLKDVLEGPMTMGEAMELYAVKMDELANALKEQK